MRGEMLDTTTNGFFLNGGIHVAVVPGQGRDANSPNEMATIDNNITNNGGGQTTLFPSKPILPAVRSRSSSSSSSGSSSSGSGSDDSSSGSSSDSSDEDETDGEKNKVDLVPSVSLSSGTNGTIKPNDLTPSISQAAVIQNKVENGKIVAGGLVVNDKIRVVPVKEKKTPLGNEEKKKRGRPCKKLKPKEVKERKLDPSFFCHVSSTTLKKKNSDSSGTQSTSQLQNGYHTPPSLINGEDSSSGLDAGGTSVHSGEHSSDHMKLDYEEHQVRGRNLRQRQTQPLLNDDYLFHIQHEMMAKELANRQQKQKRQYKKKRRPNNNPSKTALEGVVTSTLIRASGKTADWDCYLNTTNAKQFGWIASVDKFPHAILSEEWKKFAVVGTKIEIPNPYVEGFKKKVYWVATIRFFAGYKALVEYEMLGHETRFAWVSFCSNVPKPIGYCDKYGHVLYPPKGIEKKHKNFLNLLRKAVYVHDTPSIQWNHVDIIANAVKSKRRFNLEEIVEAMDCTDTHVRRLGRITGIIGDRVHVTYISKKNNKSDPGFWFNVNSECIQPIGWSQAIGLEISGVPKNVIWPKFDTSKMPSYPQGMDIRKGMVFETIHPLDLHVITAAHVDFVYRHGFFRAKIDCNPPYTSMMFIYHITSPWVLSCGFADRNGLELAVPKDEKLQTFNWDNYCLKGHLRKLDLSLLPPRTSSPFTVGEKMEAIDIRMPNYCCPVTVIKVVKHLILLHFDGYPRELPQALQWIEWDNPNLYPAGWAEMVGHEFRSTPENPRTEDTKYSTTRSLSHPKTSESFKEPIKAKRRKITENSSSSEMSSICNSLNLSVSFQEEMLTSRVSNNNLNISDPPPMLMEH